MAGAGKAIPIPKYLNSTNPKVVDISFQGEADKQIIPVSEPEAAVPLQSVSSFKSRSKSAKNQSSLSPSQQRRRAITPPQQ